jgi:hypothetical protein
MHSNSFFCECTGKYDPGRKERIFFFFNPGLAIIVAPILNQFQKALFISDGASPLNDWSAS